MKKLTFWKMSGSGNDFVVIDNRRKNLPGSSSAWAAKLCHRQFGVGADGLLLLEPPLRQGLPLQREPSFRMVYYNADGSRASMCGNGARCMAWAANAWGVVGKEFDFQTDAGIVHGLVRGETVRVTLSEPKDYRESMKVKVGGRTVSLAFINTGVPHAVVPVKDIESLNIVAEGRPLRYHRAFGPKGTNVNFVQRLNGNLLRVRTYERGVEGETLACGTGVSASAIAAALKGWVKPEVRCLTSGGDTLRVNFELHPEDPARPARQVTLEGPVRRTFIGEWTKAGDHHV